MLSFYLDPGEINVTLNPTYLKICPKFPLCYTFLSSCLCHQLEPDIISRKYHHLILKVNTYSVAIGCSPIITPISTSSLNKCGANHKFFFFPLNSWKRHDKWNTEGSAQYRSISFSGDQTNRVHSLLKPRTIQFNFNSIEFLCIYNLYI